MKFQEMFLIFCIAINANSAKLCPNGWDEIGGKTCVKYDPTERQFEETRQFCESKYFTRNQLKTNQVFRTLHVQLFLQSSMIERIRTYYFA